MSTFQQGSNQHSGQQHQHATGQQPYAGQQQPYAGPQQQYAAPQQPYTGQQQPYTGQQQFHQGMVRPRGAAPFSQQPFQFIDNSEQNSNGYPSVDQQNAAQYHGQQHYGQSEMHPQYIQGNGIYPQAPHALHPPNQPPLQSAPQLIQQVPMQQPPLQSAPQLVQQVPTQPPVQQTMALPPADGSGRKSRILMRVVIACAGVAMIAAVALFARDYDEIFGTNKEKKSRSVVVDNRDNKSSDDASSIAEAEAALAKAEELSDNGRFEAALAALEASGIKDDRADILRERIIDSQKRNDELLTQLGEQVSAKEWTKVIETVDELETIRPLTGKLKKQRLFAEREVLIGGVIRKAKKLAANGERNEAVKFIDGQIKKYPDDSRLKSLRARIVAGDFDKPSETPPPPIGDKGKSDGAPGDKQTGAKQPVSGGGGVTKPKPGKNPKPKPGTGPDSGAGKEVKPPDGEPPKTPKPPKPPSIPNPTNGGGVAGAPS